jgi:CubicO group peptidase (beta-lactamase class C family)
MSRFALRTINFILLFISFIPVPGFCQVENAESCVHDIMDKYKIVGMSVAVVKENQLIYTHSYGLKDIATNTPLTDDCLFRIASISKTFSGTSIMQLVEAGKLSLDDDVSNLVGFKIRNPKFPDTIITLRMLLSHRSSINDSQGYFTLDVINPDKNSDWAKCYNDYKPGTAYQYCNLNFNLTGTLIEKISGERFDQYVKHHVLDPLGLYGGYCVDSLDKSRFVSLYEYNVDSSKFILSAGAYVPRSEEISNYVMGYTTPVLSPTGGMKINATDLAKYMMMHMNLGRYNGKRIISKKSERLMQKNLSGEDGYGLAMMTRDSLISGKVLKGHSGDAYGLRSAMYFQPKDKFGIVIMVSSYYSDQEDGLRRIMNCLYDSFIKK